jgi:ATP-dependent RNA helicase RhlB
VAIKDKPRFLLGLIEREKPRRICVFCNLGSTAEELARRLDVNGLRSECIADSQTTGRAGPLQEKRKSEDFYALVLTDEGAQSVSSDPTRGLFSLVVNYDIPLEPDFFVKRLEMLDRADASAKVVSMVCDRYVYGLTAVEHYIEAKLDARPIDPSLLAARDLSEGMVFGRSRDIDRRRHGESRGFASGHSRDASTRDDRSPEIRRSIAEATGGSIDMGGNAIKQPVVRQASRQKSRGTALSGRGTEGRRGGKAKEPIVPENGRSVRRPPTGEAVANPYDLPME